MGPRLTPGVSSLRWPDAAPRAFWRRSRWWASSSPSSMVINGTRDDGGAREGGSTPAVQRHRDADEEAEGARSCGVPTRSSRATRHPPLRRRRTCRFHRSRSSTPTSTTRRCPSGRRSSCASERPRPRGAAGRRAGARARARRARRRPAPVGHQRRERARRRRLDRRRRLLQAGRPPALDRLGDEADDRAADARAQPPLDGVPRGPLPRPARRVEDQPPAGREDDGRRPAARAC